MKEQEREQERERVVPRLKVGSYTLTKVGHDIQIESDSGTPVLLLEGDFSDILQAMYRIRKKQ